jgi:hypothetical protein
MMWVFAAFCRGAVHAANNPPLDAAVGGEADNVRGEAIEFVFLICLTCGGQSEIVVAS